MPLTNVLLAKEKNRLTSTNVCNVCILTFPEAADYLDMQLTTFIFEQYQCGLFLLYLNAIS